MGSLRRIPQSHRKGAISQQQFQGSSDERAYLGTVLGEKLKKSAYLQSKMTNFLTTASYASMLHSIYKHSNNSRFFFKSDYPFVNCFVLYLNVPVIY
jgi:hypothetical protein